MTLRDYLFFDCKPLKFTLQLTFLMFGDMILIKFGFFAFCRILLKS